MMDWKGYLYLALATVLAAGIGVLWWRKRKGRQQTPVVAQARLTDREVVEALVGHLSAIRGMDIKVDSVPEDDPDEKYPIDAVAGPYAIEHTSIDTVESQRRQSAFFTNVVGDLEEEFRGRLGSKLSMVIPHDGIGPGQNWAEMRSGIRDWVRSNAAALADCQYREVQIPGLPFPVRVSKKTNSSIDGLYFLRNDPTESGASNDIRLQVDRKATKLKPYRQRGLKTVLLLESDDVALMNDSRFREMLERAYPDGPPDGVDEIWYVDSSAQPYLPFVDVSGWLSRDPAN